MDFDFSDDQHILRDQTRKLLSNLCALKDVRAVLEGEQAYDKNIWQGLADLGVIGASVPEQYGGAGLTMLELCVVAEELGRALAPVPFSSSVYLASEALRLAGSDALKKTYLEPIAKGEKIASFAFAEEGQAPYPANLKTTFDGAKLNGVKTSVADGMSADFAIVVAKHGDKLELCVADLQNTKRERLDIIDPSRDYARIEFTNHPAQALSEGSFSDGEALLDYLLDGAAVLYAFEQLGGAERCLEFARDYSLTRYAFGRPIGSFQAIKHKLADAYVKNQLARSNCYYAAMILDNGGAELPSAAACAHLAASDAFLYIAQENVQTHGGIGFTWESDCQLFYRRARLLSLALGSRARWQERLISALEKRNT